MSVVTTGQPKHRHSLRDGVNRLLRARPGETGFCVTVPPGSRRVGYKADVAMTRGLTSASGGQDHTLLPSAGGTARLALPPASIATRFTFRDDWP